VAALFGALAGPIAYAGGERLAVLELAPGAFPAIAAAWATVLAVLDTLAPAAAPRRAVPT
jgi:hypothetical protein